MLFKAPRPKQYVLRSTFLLALAYLLDGGTAGAQTVSVRDYGATGNGSTDDRAAIQRAIDNSPINSSVDFGPGQYTYLVSGTVYLKPNRAYTGAAAIKMSGSAGSGTTLLQLTYGQSDNVRVDGLTLDGSGVGGVLNVGVQGSNITPVSNFTLQNTTLRNSKSNGNPWEGCLYIPITLRNSTITRNRFANCSNGIVATSPSSVSITYNDFDTITSGNAMFFGIFASSSALEVSYNTGRNLTRMAIEVWGGTPGVAMDGLVLKGNSFSNWTTTANDPYGISVAVGKGAKILENTLSGGVAGYGIEVGSPESLTEGNVITGFPIGIAVMGATDTTIRNNRLYRQTDSAILLTNAGNCLRTKILSNYIENPKKAGIGALPNDFSQSVIQGNQIVRGGGQYPDDNSVIFQGIKVDSGLTGPVTVEGNTVIQSSSNPPAGFTFWGLGLFGKFPGSRYVGNRFESKSSSPFGSGMNLWSPDLLNGIAVTDTTFVNLNYSNSGSSSAGVSKANNLACRVNNPDMNVVTSTSGSCPDGAAAAPAAPVLPILSAITSAALSSSQVSIQWMTDKPADTQVEYGTSSSYGSATTRNSALVTSHSVTLTNLAPGTTYYFRVRSKDSAGNEAISSGSTVSTQAAAPQATAPNCNTPGVNAFTGCYYADTEFRNLKLVRTDAKIAFQWGYGSPDPAIPANWFSARWQGSFVFQTGRYEFTLNSDDGARLYIDNALVLDRWVPQSAAAYKVTVPLSAGTHVIKLEYFENYNEAVAQLSWAALAGASASSAGEEISQQSFAGPLQLSADQAYFTDRANTPFLWLGEAAPSLVVDRSRAEIEAYLDDCVRRGVSVVQTGLVIDQTATQGVRANPEGQIPWLNQDPATPNPDYFASVDAIVNAAAQRGIVLALVPASSTAVSNQSAARLFGQWVGERYRSAANVVWLVDLSARDGAAAAVELTKGLREGDAAAHLIGAQLILDSPVMDSQTFEISPFLAAGAFDFFAMRRQGTGDAVVSIRPSPSADLNRPSPKSSPAALLQADRSGEAQPTLQPAALAWQAYLSGGSYTRLDGKGQPFASAVLREFLDKQEWWRLGADSTLVLSGDHSHPVAAKSAGHNLAMIYSAGSNSFSVDLSKLSNSGEIIATWMDPQTGLQSPAGVFTAAGWQSFLTPGSGDALLLLVVQP